MPTATLLGCPHCRDAVRCDQPKFSNPVHMRDAVDGGTDANDTTDDDGDGIAIARCPKCTKVFWLDDAEKLAQLPMKDAGVPLADVVLVDAGPDEEAVLGTRIWSRDEPLMIEQAVSLASAQGVKEAYEKLGAVIEVHRHVRDPRWDTAPRVKELSGDERAAALKAGQGTTAEREAYLKE